MKVDLAWNIKLVSLSFCFFGHTSGSREPSVSWWVAALVQTEMAQQLLNRLPRFPN